MQRKHLLKMYHGTAGSWLPTLENAIQQYLVDFQQQIGSDKIVLRDFVAGLVLHSSSYLMGLSDWTLDIPYFENLQMKNIISSIAIYGISQYRNDFLEENLLKLFMAIVENNYSLIREGNSENLIKNIFDSLDNDGSSQELLKNSCSALMEEAAMNFASDGLGAMVHSTSNSFD
jgi:hypothetical protein